MPVLGMNVAKRPSNARQVKPACYFRIFIDVVLIIVVNEVMTEGLTKDHPRNRRERNADADRWPAAIRFRQSY